LSGGVRDACVDACIVPGIEAVDRGFDAHHRVFIRRRAIEDKSGRQIAAVGCKPERLSATQQNPATKSLPFEERSFRA